MTYGIALSAGVILGLADLGLLFLAQKREGFVLFEKKRPWKQKTVWIVLCGMGACGLWLVWVTDGLGYHFGRQMLLCGYLLPLSLTDVKYRQLPDLIHPVYGALFLLFHFFCGTWGDLRSGLVGTVVTLVFLGAVHLVKRDQFGLGDLKTLCAAAFLMGMPGIAYLFFRGLVAAAVYSGIQLLRRRADMKTEYPLAPFLLIGALL